MEPRLRLQGIRKAFGPTQALAGVTLEAATGTCVALIGENGAGKSTLMKIISGAHAADAGSMELDGVAYAPRDPSAARRRGVAIVYQELTIAADLTVAENIVLGSEPQCCGFVSQRKRDALARTALAMVGLADVDPQQRAGGLSVAHQQLVEIARALARGTPLVLVLDEPTASLTAGDAERLFLAIDRLTAAGTTVLFISHHLEECRRVANTWVVLRDGASVGHGTMAAADSSELIRLMVGRPVTELFPRIPHALGEPLLEVQAVAGEPLPVAASFTLRRGEILGIFGLVGSGRTELLRALFGLDRSRGRMLLGGRLLAGGPARRLAAGIGMVSEDRKGEGLALRRSIADNLCLTRFAPVSSMGLVDESRQAALTREWIVRLGVRCSGPFQPIGELSGGNQQKIAIGRLLHQDAQVLLLDEPTRGIDVGAKAHIYRLIGELAAQGRAIVMVSSHLPELLGCCDTLAVMQRGCLGQPRPVAGWDPHSILASAIGQDPS